MASTDSGRKLVLVSCTDPGAVQFYTVLCSLLHFACQFKPGVVNVYVCRLANSWQVQTRKKIASGILYRPWCGAILHSLMEPPPFCLPIQDRCCSCVFLWTSKLVASRDLERRLVLVSCTDPGAVQLWIVVYDLIQFESWFKTGVVNVYVCGLASWWQVRTRKEYWFWYPVQTLAQCNFTRSYAASSILPAVSRQVFSMCIFVD
jgi:hypothetical protein